MRGGRTWRQPIIEASTLHCIGDVHHTTVGISDRLSRNNHVADDLNHGDVPDSGEHLFLGDITNVGSVAEDAAFQAWAATFPGDKLYVIGNHDVGMATNIRTPAQWAAAYATPGNQPNYIYDLDFGVRLIVVSFDSIPGDGTTIRLSDDTMTWLDAQLTAAGNTPCFVLCHAPLYDTVLGPVDVGYGNGSQDSGFFAIGGSSAAATNSIPILNLLASHSNVKAWISGHTHTPIETPTIVTSLVVGSNTIACINTSSVAYLVGPQGAWLRPCSPYITYLGDRIEVRWRDHFRKLWVAPHGNPAGFVMAVDL